ncbi:MAG: IclR family transcriptional regulator [bacterium]|nr:IclR family transcriptional regulator [bacterium]MCY3924288.1 IclR family transcriptional regulator [bacterium]
MTGLDVLEALSTQPAPVGVSDLARLIDADKGNVHRLLAALERRGYVGRNDETKTYTLAAGVVQLAGGLLRNMDLVTQARPLMRDLVNLTGESVHLAARTVTGGVYIARERLARRVTVETEIGSPVVVHATSTGKALYCRAGEAELRELLGSEEFEAFTQHTITSVEGLLDDLRRTAERGYALDDEELSIGVRCVAAPVVDISGQVLSSIGLSGPASRLDEERLDKCAALVCDAARTLSGQIGGAWDFPSPPAERPGT